MEGDGAKFYPDEVSQVTKKATYLTKVTPVVIGNRWQRLWKMLTPSP